ncbi:7158_t:CDS:2 [Ambispora leptoticha]|uniref:7158_t:CDS:1 n=1 Tax=Ambispora leptoticha TaxID=144679 RepID=A0A9N8ZLB2_9GLOM|nr:7158_t:CDS:2 [Ambispora leptoticha]
MSISSSFTPYLPKEYFLRKKRNGEDKSKAPNGFLIFRACTVAKWKDLNFQMGDARNISRLASDEWKRLPKHEKENYKKFSNEIKKSLPLKPSKVNYKNLNEKECKSYQNYALHPGYQDVTTQNHILQFHATSYQDGSIQNHALQSNHSSEHQDESIQNSVPQFEDVFSQNLALQSVYPDNYRNDSTQNLAFQFDYSSNNQTEFTQNPPLQLNHSSSCQDEWIQNPALQIDHPNIKTIPHKVTLFSFITLPIIKTTPQKSISSIYSPSENQDESIQNPTFQFNYAKMNSHKIFYFQSQVGGDFDNEHYFEIIEYGQKENAYKLHKMLTFSNTLTRDLNFLPSYNYINNIKKAPLLLLPGLIINNNSYDYEATPALSAH